jgi:hypothetical protein
MFIDVDKFFIGKVILIDLLFLYLLLIEYVKEIFMNLNSNDAVIFTANNCSIILRPPPSIIVFQKQINTLNALLVFLGNKY